MVSRPSSVAIGWWPAGVMSITASRRLASPAGPSTWLPWSSGPRWAIASPISLRIPSWTICPGRARMPAIPHMRPGLRGLLECALLVRAPPLDHRPQALLVVELRGEADQPLGLLRRTDAVRDEHLLVGAILGLQAATAELQQRRHELLDRGLDA